VEKDFLRANDLAQILGCSKSTSYRLMRQIRKELTDKGLLTLPGIVPRSYTLKRLGVNANVI
jgi:predicted DNA-binding transcriptional regulator AlpA